MSCSQKLITTVLYPLLAVAIGVTILRIQKNEDLKSTRPPYDYVPPAERKRKRTHDVVVDPPRAAQHSKSETNVVDSQNRVLSLYNEAQQDLLLSDERYNASFQALEACFDNVQSFSASFLVIQQGFLEQITREDLTLLERAFQETYNILDSNNCNPSPRIVINTHINVDSMSQREWDGLLVYRDYVAQRQRRFVELVVG